MIRIRYRDSSEFSPGLHAAAECRGRATTIYLLPGLTAPQRRAALRRLRLSARMGRCPRLPAAQLAIALLADGIRTAFGRAGAVFRLHPAGSTVPVMVLSGGAIAFLFFSAVSIQVLPAPQTAPQSAAGPPPVASAGAVPIAGVSRGQPGGPGQGSGTSQLAQPGSGGSSLARLPSLAPPRVGATSGAGTTLSGGDDPAQATSPQAGTAGSTPAPAATGSPQGAAAPSSSAPQPAPSTTPASSGVCVKVGPLGVCVKI